MTDVEEIRKLVDSYRLWLRDKTSLKKVDDNWVEITTPFLDRHNDYIQMYVRKQGAGFDLNDDGNTLADLEQSGCAIDTPKRKALLRVVLNGYGVHEDNGTLGVKATVESFAMKKHALTQAILSVNDLFFTATSIVRSLFKEDVQQWLDLSNIRYLPDVTLMGHSGYPHHFDFAIPKSRSAPSRLLKTLNNPNKDSAESMMFAWVDSREQREDHTKLYAVLNNSQREVTVAVLEALRSYEIEPLLWSAREQFVQPLAA